MKRIRTMMRGEEFYRGLDAGIRFAVRVLHANGFETCQSCQGGKGHCYDRPTVDLIAASDDAIGFGALRCLQAYGLPIRDVSIVWPIDRGGTPYEKLWRVTFWKTIEERANEKPIFLFGYVAMPFARDRRKKVKA